MYGTDWGWGFMAFMPLLWIVLLAAVIWAVVEIAQPQRHDGALPGRDVRTRESPREILDRRFASGEIDAEAYTLARDHLAGHGPRSS